MKPGTLVKYSGRIFLGEIFLGIILKEEHLGPTDYAFYRVLLEDGKISVLADTKLTPVCKASREEI